MIRRRSPAFSRSCHRQSIAWFKRVWRKTRKIGGQSARDLLRELRWIAETGSSAIATTAAFRTRQREWLAWIAAVVAMLAVIALVVGMFRQAVPELLVTRLDIVTPQTSDPFAFALAPDGRQLVFAVTEETGARLWRRRLDETTAQPLPGTEGASAPFWAPDGRAIGFFADGNLKRLDLDGGLPPGSRGRSRRARRDVEP